MSAPAPAVMRAPTRGSRVGALTRAADHGSRARLGAQLAKLSAWIIGLGYGLAMVMLARASGGTLLEPLLADALGWLTWLTGGVAALSLAGAGGDQVQHRALGSLAEQRGLPATGAQNARGLAALRRVFRLTAVPAVLLALLALGLSSSLGVAGWRLLLCVAVAGYCAVVALMLGGLAHIAAVLAPNQPRSMLVMLVFLPHLARAVWPDLPSVPWALGELVDRIGSLST